MGVEGRVRLTTPKPDGAYAWFFDIMTIPLFA